MEKIEKALGIENWYQNIGSSRSNIVFFIILALISVFIIFFTPYRYALLLVATIICGIFIFLYPFLGIYAYYIIEIIAPQTLVYAGDSQRTAMIISLVTGVAGLLLFMRTKPKFIFVKQNYIILCFWGCLLISCFFAQYQDIAWQKFMNYYSKFFIFFFISTNLIMTKRQFLGVIEIFTSMFVLFGIHGIKRYLSGDNIVTGIGGKLGTDNNLFGMMMVIGISFVLYPFLMKESVSLRKKICILIFLPAVIFTVICTFSRGAFLGMVGVLFLIFLRIKRKLLVLLLILCILPILPFILPSGYKERLSTISNYQQDGSAVGRIEAWKAGFEMIRTYPLTGIGLQNFSYFVEVYNPDAIYGKKLVAHNAYIELAAEAGLITFFFYVLLIITSVIDLSKLRKKFIGNKENYWAIPITYLLECSFCGYLICSMFGSTETYEVLYFLCGMVVMLKRVTVIEKL